MRITAFARGGLAVHGGSYDPKCDEAVVCARDGETVALTIEYPSTPSSVTDAEAGIACTAPAVSGNKATATLSSITEGGYVDIQATVGGAIRVIRIRGRSASQLDEYDT